MQAIALPPTLADWQVNAAGQLERCFRFETFLQAVGFINRLAEAAEAHEHHPDVNLRYSQVIIRLCTHDAGHQVTEKDIRLAEILNHLV